LRERNLLTEHARQVWLHWKRTRSQIDDWRAPQPEAVDAKVRKWFDVPFPRPVRHGKVGTVHCSALGPSGDVACCTSTSGHASSCRGESEIRRFWEPDSTPDNEIGTCGSIGHGEANWKTSPPSLPSN